MMKKGLLGLLGCGLLAGAAVYALVKYLNKESQNVQEEVADSEEIAVEILPEQASDETPVDLDSIKIQSAVSIQDRHNAAAEVINEAMKAIDDGSELPGAHEDELDELLRQLETLS